MTSPSLLLHKYRLERLLGQGAFAEVYLATHLDLQQPRALKILRKDTPGLGSTDYANFVDRFKLEAQLGARLDHPNLVRVYDLERDGDIFVLVMEYCPGGSLADRLAQAKQTGQPLSVESALRLGQEVALGLGEVHKMDAVHRDLKPSNVLFDALGRARLADLGLAQVPGGPSLRSKLSQPEPHPGTPGYKSPEQERSGEFLRPSSDVYALGLLLFEALTLRNYSLIKPGTRLRSLRADAPAWMDDLLARMLAKDPDQRPWDGTEAAELLRQGESETAQRMVEAKQKASTEAWQSAAVKTEQEAREQAERQAQEIAARQAKERAELEAAERKRKELILELAPGVSMEFVRVPAGEFLMGSDKSKDKTARDNETPQHKLYLPDYLIGKHPVTVEQFAAFVNATGHKSNAESDLKTKANHPVTKVTWKDAVAFCQWASRQTGQSVRLPSEAEWEKAARGADGRIYPWGDQSPDRTRCNYDVNETGTTPVGKYSPQGDSPYGCADMSGNVWEWTSSIYQPYPYDPKDGREDPESEKIRVLRGGAWNTVDYVLRVSHRDWLDPVYLFNCVGFRCARSL